MALPRSRPCADADHGRGIGTTLIVQHRLHHGSFASRYHGGMSVILGLETSCDETAAAVVEDGHLLRSNVIASQHELHEPYGGVVPEIASRAHLERLCPVVQAALGEAEVGFGQLDAVAVGHRPGLIGSLLVGVSAAKGLAWRIQRPLIGVDHVAAHLHAAVLHRPAQPAPEPGYPLLGLVVSGGHTSLYRIDVAGHTQRLGSTIDDAAGEAYDKAAVILQAGYPGGPSLDRLAQRGDAAAGPKLPRSMLGSDSLDFSFSGLKTALLYAVRGRPQGRGAETTHQRTAAELSETERADFAAAFQDAAIGVLIAKLERAIGQMKRAGQHPRGVVVGGGVSANA